MSNDILHIIHTYLERSQREKEATEIRRQNYLDQCAEQNIKFMVHQGVVGNLSPYKNINAAHKKVIKYGKDNNLPYIHIAEDDFVFTGKGGWKYYLDNLPESFDMYCSVIYHGTVENQKVLSAFSGGMSLYTIHSKFYDKILNAPEDVHLDRWTGEQKEFEILVPPKYCIKQLGGYSFNLVRSLTYTEIENRLLEEGKEFYT